MKQQKKSTLSRLLRLNLLVLLTLVFVTVVMLWALGLLESVLAFLF